MKIKIILALGLGIAFMILVLQNTEVVIFQFFVWQFSLSRIILLPLIFGSGFVVGYVSKKIKSSSLKE